MSLIRALGNSPDDVALGTELVREYVIATAEEIGQDIEIVLPLIPELHDFPARYLSGGAFLIAEEPEGVAGCVGVTPMDGGTCEMNRLWVREAFRRRGLARALSVASMDAARELGFTRMILDVLSERAVAIALYRSLGFADTAPKHDYPFDMVFLARDL